MKRENPGYRHPIFLQGDSISVRHNKNDECFTDRNQHMKKIFQHTMFYFIIVFFLSGISLAQEPIHGVVVNIADGDTVTVWEKEKQYIIRLYGIDTPEKTQDFSMKAKKFTANMVFNKDLTVIPKGVGKYGRIIGMVYIGQKCLNEELIRNGFAWVYKRYCSESFCNDWLQLEQEARVNKLGLWIYDNPIPPWDFRSGKSIKSNVTGVYHGNVSSLVFHAPDCKHFNCKRCTKVFQDRALAISAGYKPCGICKP